jgi:amino acid adenylation domain-containing protein
MRQHDQEHQNKSTGNTGTGLSSKQQAVLAKLLKGNVSEELKVPRIPKRETHSPLPLSYAQQRLWVLDRMVPGNPFYNLPTAVHLPGELDTTVLERALNEIVRRHETLRTVFTLDSTTDEPVQVIRDQFHIKVKTVDLSGLSANDRQAGTAQFTSAEIAKPFDLEQGPLLRVVLLKLAKSHHVALMTMHHIISDAGSLEIMMRELTTLYAVYAADKPSPLLELRIQYGDFAMWQKNWMQGEVLEKQLAYWRGILSGELPILEMPTDHQRPAVPTYRGSMQYFDFPDSLVVQLVALNRTEHCSMFMTLLAAINVLLNRYTGQEDIMVGSPIANRTRPELEQIIGFFANTLIFRTDLSGEQTFRELLNRVRTIASGAYDNQDMPFEKLVEEFQPDRYMSHTPFFQVMFNYKGKTVKEQQTAAGGPAKNESGGMGEFAVHNETSKFDLWFTLHHGGDQLWGGIEYNTDIFENSTVSRLMDHFENILLAVTDNPDKSIAELSILTTEEKEQLLVHWNDTVREYHIQCLHHTFEEQVERTPSASALLFADRQLSYDELNCKANRLAHILMNRGVNADMPVGIGMERSLEMVIAMLAILKAGGAYLPLDPEYPAERLAFMMADAGISILLTQEEVFKALPPFKGEVLCLDTQEYWDSAADEQGFDRNPQPKFLITVDHLAYIIYTSGSTGRPKGVMISHKGISNRLHWMQEAYGLTPQDRVLQKTPFSFDVSVWEFFWPLLTGAQLVMALPGGHKDSAYLVKTIEEQEITTIHFVPSMLNVFLEDPKIKLFSRLKRVISSGEALPAEYRDRFFQRLGKDVELHNLYGPTEASVDVTAFACKPGDNNHHIPIGKPIANTGIFILDKHLHPVPVGVHGELHIGGIQLARGYLNRPELTAQRFVAPNWSYMSYRTHGTYYKTGDLARWQADGNIEYIGRLDHQVKIRGFRIELGEIESYLRAHEHVRDSAVLAVEDSPGSESKKLVGYIVPYFDYRDSQETDTNKQLSGELVNDWQGVFDDTYAKESDQEDATFNISGWNSSYTGRALPKEEMRQWVDHTVERILALKPGNVLEIGCGTGLFLIRIIPHCKSFLGTDIAPRGLEYIRRQLQEIETQAQVELMQRPADDFDSINGDLDLVILNSVVQYFPNAGYLEKVIKGAVKKIKPGGHIFVGDVRSLPLLRIFHASVEASRAESGTSREQLLQTVINQVAREQELVFDPAYFSGLKNRIPEISGVQLLLKYGSYSNELSKFRFDVILHIGMRSGETHPVREIEWNSTKPGIAEMRELLIKEENGPGVLVLSGVPNQRITADIHLSCWLNGSGAAETIDRYRENAARSAEPGMDPEDFRRLSKEIPYSVDITLSASGEPGTFDVVFVHHRVSGFIPGVSGGFNMERQPDTLFNNPLLQKISWTLIPELRSYLKERIPEYMIPIHFGILERLPLTANGKLDRKALPEPFRLTKGSQETVVEPSTEMEKLLASIWSQVLNVNKIGINHNFFELGGDSIKAIQVISRTNKEGHRLTVQHLYQNQNIADLATAAMKIQPAETVNLEDLQLSPDIDEKILYRHLPKGTVIEDVLPVSPLQRHMLECLENLSEPDPGLFLIHKSNLPQRIHLNPRLLQQVLDKVTAHRALLRTAFVWKDLEEPVQVICKEGKTPLIYKDWSRLSPEKQQRKFKQLIAKQWHMGFDRSKPTALRMVFVKLAEYSYQYFFTSDYVRFDGWSSGIIQSEIINCYLSMEMGQDLKLKEENYYNYYLAELGRCDMDAAKQYWTSIMEGYVPVESLLNKFPGNQPGTAEGFARQHIYYPLNTSLSIHIFLHKYRLVHSTLIYAAWGLLMSVYSDQQDVVFGVIYSGRGLATAEMENMVGNTINVLPVRMKFEPDEMLLSWLKRIFHEQQEAGRYEYTPIKKIHEWCGYSPDKPLMEGYIVMQNLPGASFNQYVEDPQSMQDLMSRLQQQSAQSGPMSGQTDNTLEYNEIPPDQREYELFYAKMEYPLRVDVYMPNQLCPVFNYDRSRISDPVVKSYMENLKTVLEAIIVNPHQSVGELMKCIDTQPLELEAVDFV